MDSTRTTQRSLARRWGQTRVKLVLDLWMAGLFVFAVHEGFHAAKGETASGLTHELLGLAMGALAAVHLLQHRRWIAKKWQGLWSGRRSSGRTDVVLGALLAVTFAVMLVSGLLISRNLGWDPLGGGGGVAAHHASTKLGLALVIWHVVRHRAWIARAVRGRKRSSAR